jgi:hypothetical protein
MGREMRGGEKKKAACCGLFCLQPVAAVVSSVLGHSRYQRVPVERCCCLYQAMLTAMNASKKISTAPTTGKTMGIRGTTASTGSVGVALSW